MKETKTEEDTERRTAFYIRIETAEEIRITWKTIPLYSPYLGILLYLVFGFLSNTTINIDCRAVFALIGVISLLVLFVYFFVMFICTRRVSGEIKTAMREKSVELTGNKWSLSNPQTVIIKKDTKSY